jgi:hypothetical protein
MVATREGRALRRVSDFVSALERASINSKASLARKWLDNGVILHLTRGAASCSFLLLIA